MLPSIRVTEDQELLKEISQSTVDQFDMPHRSISNVTVVPSMFLSWHDISAQVRRKEEKSFLSNFREKDFDDVEKLLPPTEKLILDNVYGYAHPGKVMAIMGSSGAGKSSLLNILTQRNLGEINVKGYVKVNGLKVTKSYMKKISAYVQQEDCFIGSLTVEEHLNFNAKLRMNDKYSDADQHRRVRQVMTDLGLRGSANTIIGTRTRKGLSGGEKKRLSFASEILTSPPILLCDEPTSGLDAFLAFQVVSVLKRLAERKGMTIILTIHQPSSQVFELFDNIYLMAEGKVAFCGNHTEAMEMWTKIGYPVPLNFNPSDHFITTLSITQRLNSSETNKVDSICNYFKKSPLGKQVLKEARSSEYGSSSNSEASSLALNKDPINIKYHAGWFVQLQYLMMRNFKNTIREPTLLQVQIIQSVVIALLTGIVYVENTVTQNQIMNINGAIFQMITEMAFMFQFSSVHNFCQEFSTFHREHSSYLYRVSTYFLAKNFAELPTYTFCAAVFATILYWMSGLVPLWDVFLVYVACAILVQNIAVSFGYMVGCIFASVPLAMTVLPLFVVPAMAFAGFFINEASLPPYFRPLRYISHIGYAYETVAVNEWRHVDHIPGCNMTIPGFHCLSTGDDVIDFLSFKKANMWPNLVYLCLLLIAVRFVAFIGLYTRTKLKR